MPSSTDLRRSVSAHRLLWPPQQGWLKNYRAYAGGKMRTGAEMVDYVATNYSISPRLLLAVLEYQGGALTQPEFPPANICLDSAAHFTKPLIFNWSLRRTPSTTDTTVGAPVNSPNLNCSMKRSSDLTPGKTPGRLRSNIISPDSIPGQSTTPPSDPTGWREYTKPFSAIRGLIHLFSSRAVSNNLSCVSPSSLVTSGHTRVVRIPAGVQVNLSPQ